MTRTDCRRSISGPQLYGSDILLVVWAGVFMIRAKRGAFYFLPQDIRSFVDVPYSILQRNARLVSLSTSCLEFF